MKLYFKLLISKSKNMQNHCVIIENNDLIQILEGYVIKAYLKKKSNEIEDARNFHEENYINRNSIDINDFLVGPPTQSNYPVIIRYNRRVNLVLAI